MLTWNSLLFHYFHLVILQFVRGFQLMRIYLVDWGFFEGFGTILMWGGEAKPSFGWEMGVHEYPFPRSEHNISFPWRRKKERRKERKKGKKNKSFTSTRLSPPRGIFSSSCTSALIAPILPTFPFTNLNQKNCAHSLTTKSNQCPISNVCDHFPSPKGGIPRKKNRRLNPSNFKHNYHSK